MADGTDHDIAEKLRHRSEAIEGAVMRLLSATVDGGSGTIRLPDTDHTRQLLADLNRAFHRGN